MYVVYILFLTLFDKANYRDVLTHLKIQRPKMAQKFRLLYTKTTKYPCAAIDLSLI